MRCLEKLFSLAITCFSLSPALPLLTVAERASGIGLILTPTVAERAFGNAQAQSIEDKQAELFQLVEQGGRQFNASQFKEGLTTYQQALKILRQLTAFIDGENRAKLKAWEESILRSIGIGHYRLGEYDNAIKAFQESLAISRGINNENGEVLTLNGLGNIYNLLGRNQDALAFYEQALNLLNNMSKNADKEARIAIRKNKSTTINNIGNIYISLGQYNKALEYVMKSLAISQELEDRSGEKTNLSNIGIIYTNLGDMKKALVYFEKSLAISQEINDLIGQSITLNNLGLIYGNMGNTSKALDYYNQSLLITRKAGDKNGEKTTINNIGSLYDNLGDYKKALEYYKQSLAISRVIGDKPGEKISLNNIGSIYNKQGDYKTALIYYEAALNLAKEQEDKPRESITLNNIANTYGKMGDYQSALSYYQQALELIRLTEDKASESISLNNIGTVYVSLGDYQTALQYFQQSLQIIETLGHKPLTGVSLNNIGNIYDKLGNYQEALQYYEEAVKILAEAGDRANQGSALNNMGTVYTRLGEYNRALKYYQDALSVQTSIGNQTEVSNILNNLGNLSRNQGNYKSALDYYTKALAIAQKIGNRYGENTLLANLGETYQQLGESNKALEYFDKALSIASDINDRVGQATILNNFGIVYTSLGQYSKALKAYEKSLKISREMGEQYAVGVSLNNMGIIHNTLGHKKEALDYYQQALELRKKIGDKAGLSTSLNNIGFIYFDQKKYEEALKYFQQSLELNHEIGNLASEATVTNNIGNVYENLGQKERAIEYYEKALKIAQATGDKDTEARAINNIGYSYFDKQDYQKTLEYFQQALAISRGIKNHELEATILNNLGIVWEKQGSPELAVFFFKQSVNTYKNSRRNIRSLSQVQQQSYVDTVSYTYRRLADILLQLDRVLEAQRVLDLLKVQELEDYLSNIRGNNNTQSGIDNLPGENKILDEYNKLQELGIKIGQELSQLRRIGESQRTEAQKRRIEELVKEQQKLVKQYVEFTRRPDIVGYTKQLSRTAKEQNLSLTSLRNLSDNLKRLQSDAALLYPLILDDRLELILVTPDSPPLRRTVSVKKSDLNRVILEFRQALTDPNKDAKTSGKKLYDWLIQPLEKDLQTAGTKTLIYAPDSQLRYVPLSALYDGKQWLIERYAVNYITAASLTDFNTRPQQDLKVLAGAFSQGKYQVRVGSRQFDFNGLPFAKLEVDNLSTEVPNTTKLLDGQFSKDSTVSQLDDYSVIHLATHAAFVPGSPDDSFILFGNGDRVTLSEVQDTWLMTNVDLVVLSACETGVGGELGNGEEILGFGYLMQNAGARATITSLWRVDDGGTQLLMNNFYNFLDGKKLSKVEALRQAQISLINANKSGVGDARGLGVLATNMNVPATVETRLDHPYYWAPFILIGNGL